MAVSEEYLKFVLDQLSDFGDIDIKRMFGGVGIFKDGLMFGKIGGDTFRLKVDENNQKDFEERGMKPFHSEKKKKGMPYWEVPIDVLEDKQQLLKWAEKSFDAAIKGKN
jgi:DNA transformation protein